ncbi:NADP-dependent oxidoreductase [Paenibacillus prosopidis]|uniref:NADPH:quinone reductase-like Zn-dependent oxidoreductase n=1 Tax=Paenibacillus prosopidis TaxID=630520 RepID=A0A368VXC0_9BACL|nr:NADP-dependent oxidoreductase [Paenibacillus prosopidis]RCW45432.1 NADPH:quinone reductase-like Zn-dependent oxidoreductase [Paenibacillus prosopidis]
MRAAGFYSFGSPEMLELIEIETPQAGAGEVRIRVKAAGVQPVDCAVRNGFSPPGVTITFPHVTGGEFAGVIDQIGEGVTYFAVGAEVLGFRLQFTYAEYVVVPVNQIVAKPDTMPWEVAGGLSGAGQTAHTAMAELRVGKGDTVLINGAAGGVGTVAVQVARARGAAVIGTASEANQEYLRSLGAIPVIYGAGLIDRVRALAPNGVDAALDAAGEEGLRVAAELVKDKDRVGTIVAFQLTEELGVRWIRSNRSASRLAELVQLYSEGKLRIHIRNTYPLSQASAAHREVETGHGRGKVVLMIESITKS